MGLLSLYKTKERDLPRTYAYTVSSDSLTTTTMSTTSYSTSDSRPTSRHYETGFPDSFASCTTSMRHPDAILDPGFAISAEHIDPAKTLHRSRKSLLRKHRRTISYGKINEGTLGQNFTERPHSRLSAADSATELVDQKSHDLAQPSKAGAESRAGQRGLKVSWAYPQDSSTLTTGSMTVTNGGETKSFGN